MRYLHLLIVFLVITLLWGCGSGDTASQQAEKSPMTVSLANPLNSAPINAHFLLNFSEPLNQATLISDYIYIRDNVTSGAIESELLLSEQSVTIRPLLFLQPEHSYSLVVDTGVQDAQGRSLSQPFTLDFITDTKLDDTPPQLAGMLPGSGEVDVDPKSVIIIAFDESLDPSTISDATLSVNDGVGSVSGTTVYEGNTLRFVPESDLQASAQIDVTLEGTIRDFSQNEYGGVRNFIFSTAESTVPVNEGFFPLGTEYEIGSTSYAVAIDTEKSLLFAGTDDGVEIVGFTHNDSSVSMNLRSSIGMEEAVYGITPDTSRMILFAATRNSGVCAIEYTDPALPEVLGCYPLAAPVYGLHLEGNTLYAAASIEGIVALDVSDTSVMSRRFSFDTNGTAFYAVPAAGNIYVADYDGGVVELDGSGLYRSTYAIEGVARFIFPDTLNERLLLAQGYGGMGEMTFVEPSISYGTHSHAMHIESVSDSSEHTYFYVSEWDRGVAYYDSWELFTPISRIDSGENIVATAHSTELLFTLSSEGSLRVYNLFRDASGPSVTETTPSNGETGVSLDSELRVTFDELLDAESLHESQFVLRNESNTSLLLSMSYDAATNTVTLIPDTNLIEFTDYTLSITQSMQDIYGNTGDGSIVDISFTTLDLIGPYVASITPVDGAIEVPLDSSIDIVFSEALNQASLLDSMFDLKDASGNSVGYTRSYDAGSFTVRLTPIEGLTELTAYTLVVTQTMSDIYGNSGDGSTVQVSFTSADVTGPSVVSTTPSDGATGVTVGTVIDIVFSEALDETSLQDSMFDLKDAGGNNVAYTRNYDSGTYTVTLTPQTTLSSETTYTLNVTEAMSDEYGNPGDGTIVTVTFTTADVIGPYAVSTTPYYNQVQVPLDSTIDIVFSEALDETSLQDSMFDLRDEQNISVPYSRSYNAGSYTVTLTPVDGLAEFTQYTLFITYDMKDLAGNPGDGSTIEIPFRSADVTGPFVAGTDPENEAVILNVDANVTIAFNEPLDQASLSTSQFVFQDSDYLDVEYTMSYSDGNVTLDPVNALISSIYYVTVIQSMKDVYGNPGDDSNYSIQFWVE